MKQVNFLNMIFLSVLVLIACNSSSASKKPGDQYAMVNTMEPVEETTRKSDTKIQVALLLDTSNSMDGLIEQAKSRLWNIVNTLTTLKFEGKSPQIEISLYEYGNNGIKNDNWIRQVIPFTTDLDMISGKLFALTTNGGSEYCGAVIEHALMKLDWGREFSDMKLIYIAGNEPFNQGDISYKTVIPKALSNNVFVNTIHCGNTKDGINGFWKDAAMLGKGKYFNIDHDAKVRFIETPYDDRISECNVKLNNTYIGYGNIGRSRKEFQAEQDANAESISSSNKTERIISKSRGIYKNESWDLVDMVKQNNEVLASVDKEKLPVELKNKSKAELEAVVNEMIKERETIQKEINELAMKRQQYIDDELKNEKDSDDLGNAITESILAFAQQKGYEVE